MTAGTRPNTAPQPTSSRPARYWALALPLAVRAGRRV
jgi:hypothetical protein